MAGVLVVGECVDGVLSEVTRELVTAAVALDGPVTLGIATAGVDDVIDAASISGVETIVTVSMPSVRFDAELQRRAVDALVDHAQPAVILMGFTIRAASFAAAIAETRNLGFASDVVWVGNDTTGVVTAKKTIYGGHVVAELGFPIDAPVLLLLRPSVWEPAPNSDTAPPRTDISVGLDLRAHVRHVEFIVPASDVDLKGADVIFSVGRGVGSQENIQVFADLAKKMGAALGASRPIVDAGWLPSGHQVGQTGVSVKPRVYVAFGISGALQHLAGISGAKTIVAINTDESAPIFGIAHAGAVADIFEVAAELEKLLLNR